MKLSNKVKLVSIILLLIINIILRFQVVSREIGWDSFEMHIMTNSLSEFGYAKWILNPLSFAGIYPASYASSMHFFLSSMFQLINIEMNSIIFLYCIFIGILSIFTAYLMAGAIINDDIFKVLVAFGFSTGPAILSYTTWTIPTRGLLIVLAPLLIYLLIKSRISIKYIPLFVLLSAFLFTTHHLFYFFIPVFFAFIILIVYSQIIRYIGHINFLNSEKLGSVVILVLFALMFYIPFFTGRFVETSRYAPIYTSYIRYIGVFVIPAIGGLFFLILKHNKSFTERFLVLSIVFITTFIYQQTYLKSFFSLFAILLGSIGLINIINLSKRKKYVPYMIVVFLLLSTSFSGYYQFLHEYRGSFNERYIEDSTYNTGHWIRDNVKGVSISNDQLFGARIFSVSKVPHFTALPTANQIYGFVNVDISDFKRYPLSSEEFWFSGYEGPDIGDYAWGDVIRMRVPYEISNISFVVENNKAGGNLVWRHGYFSAPLLKFAYGDNCIYDIGNIHIWHLN